MNIEQPNKTIAQNMGDDASRVFSGETQSQVNKEMYGETAEFFANEIKRRLPVREEPYTIADIGAFQGELLEEVMNKLPEYKFTSIATDINEQALQKNSVSEGKVVTRAEKLPFADESIDIAIMRYVLVWNEPEKQKEILAELARTVKEFALVEHGGADIADTEEWRNRIGSLFSGNDVPKLKRGEHFFASRDEIEGWMQERGINFERLRDRIVQNMADIFIERYALDAENAEKTKEVLGDKNYVRQTDWIIYPQGNR